MCSSGKVETEKHFILECEALKDSRENYAGILAANSWDNLFSKECVEKLGAIIVKLWPNTKVRWKNNLSHRLFVASWTLKILSFFLSETRGIIVILLKKTRLQNSISLPFSM
jgi:hypothetical protein